MGIAVTAMDTFRVSETDTATNRESITILHMGVNMEHIEKTEWTLALEKLGSA